MVKNIIHNIVNQIGTE